ncbi:DUF262 domain-containing protein [Hydrogenibacillus sp. N12]|nr:DUF262 domain-containing protein [Hydrogenibacillus sp. N12]QZA33230.1 DUF262 domain-containing HNH endonuclease family protein [Hydrogenibacillus sp. N12]
MQEIRADAKNLRALLGGTKFSVDYYQREYGWQSEHVTELIKDLAEEFKESHRPGNDRSAVEHYHRYFLGSIIISNRDGKKFIVDGQQRLTTLTLLLIFLYRHLNDEEQKAQLADLIFSRRFGRRSFNLDIEERYACMDALFTGKPFDETGQPESVVNIYRRYQDVTEYFPEELRGEALPYFADWLIENVYLVEITVYSDADAYRIFETMNDRGLRLTPTDMLKGYLLANITDERERIEASRVWREQVKKLQEIGKGEESDGIKAWLRSQYAESIRDRKNGTRIGDFELIGSEFHRWVRDKKERMGLTNSAAFARLIKEDFSFYSRWYAYIRSEAEKNKIPGLEAIYYNAQLNFTLQHPVLLAPLRRDDSEEEIRAKLNAVATYLDILLARRIWNWRAIDYSTMQDSMFQIMREIRGQDLPALIDRLLEWLNADKETFSGNPAFRLHGMNGRQVHYLLARMTDYVETQSGRPSRFHEYIQRQGAQGYEIEHIWANQYDRHADEFSHPSDFAEYRNRIGGLLLLPKSFNASYGDLPYEEKRKHYLKQNLLAQSLHEEAYEHDPGFVRFVKESGLPFRPHAEFKKADLVERQELYRLLAEKVWSPERLLRIDPLLQ